MAALHMDKLIRPLGLHPSASRVREQANSLRRTASATVQSFCIGMGVSPSVSLVYWMAINRQMSSRMAIAAARAASW